jgi:hypothetical protein
VLKTFYLRLLDKGKAKKVALVACIHKLLSILNVICQSGPPWRENCQESLGLSGFVAHELSAFRPGMELGEGRSP